MKHAYGKFGDSLNSRKPELKNKEQLIISLTYNFYCRYERSIEGFRHSENFLIHEKTSYISLRDFMFEDA